MHLIIYGRGLKATRSLRDHVERRLLFALGRFTRLLHSVRVTVCDENGPRGGMDKRCKIQMSTSRHGTLVVDDTSWSLQAAVDNAADRAQRALKRTLERRYRGSRKRSELRGEGWN